MCPSNWVRRSRTGPPLRPTVRDPGACGTLFHASMICITQNRVPMSGTERTIGSFAKSKLASE